MKCSRCGYREIPAGTFLCPPCQKAARDTEEASQP